MYESIAYEVDGATAVITLDRPHDHNTFVPPILDEMGDAVSRANRDRQVKVIVLQGAGRSFSGGFNFAGGFHYWDDHIAPSGKWDPGQDLIMVNSEETGWVARFMSLWNSPKPVIAQVHGWCVGGASELALCADIVIAAEDAHIGTPYSRMWGCHHAAMWVYRLGMAKAKELALTGRPVSGVEAVEIGLINKAVPFERLQAEVRDLAGKLATIPASQLFCMKDIVNQAYESMGLRTIQKYGSAMDSMMRNTQEALDFIDLVEREGVRAGVEKRDGPFGDYSQGQTGVNKPDPSHVVYAGSMKRDAGAAQE